MALAYDPARGLEVGTGVDVVCDWISGSADPGPKKDWLDHKPAAYRRVALLRVTKSVIAVGAIQIAVERDGTVRLRVGLESTGWRCCGLRVIPAAGLKLDDLDEWWDAEFAEPEGADPQAVATALAKGLAERTRDEVRELRAVRSTIEGRLSEGLRVEHGSPHPGGGLRRSFARALSGGRPAKEEGTGAKADLASLIEVARVANRAREQCREGVRDGTALWRTDDANYHLHRRLMDPTLIRSSHDPDPLTAQQPPWFRQHDAGIRQLQSAADQLGEETAQIYGLLDGATTMAALRDAEAQEQLNVVAAVAAVGLGIPGLVFALYGADVLVPFREGEQRAVLGLILVVTFAVLMFVLARMRRTAPTSRETLGAAVLIAVVLAVMLFVVASVNPGRSETRLDCVTGEGGNAFTCTRR